MSRRLGYLSLLLAGTAVVAARVADGLPVDWPVLGGISTELLVGKSLTGAAVVLGTYGVYLVVTEAIDTWSGSKARHTTCETSSG